MRVIFEIILKVFKVNNNRYLDRCSVIFSLRMPQQNLNFVEKIINFLQ